MNVEPTIADNGMPDLAGRKAVVVGASRGLGRGVAEAMSAAGASVVAIARDRAGLEDLARAAPSIEHRRSRTRPIRSSRAPSSTRTIRTYRQAAWSHERKARGSIALRCLPVYEAASPETPFGRSLLVACTTVRLPPGPIRYATMWLGPPTMNGTRTYR